MQIIRYTASYQQQWDNFVVASKNGTFLIQRPFMEYHADRFSDHSLLVFNDKNQLQAVLPANERGGALYSHEGLTYGGLIVPFDIKINAVIECWRAIASYAAANGLEKIYYKAIPAFYHQQPAYDEQYALFLLGASIYRVDTAFVVEQSRPIAIQQRRRRAIAKAEKLSIEIRQDADCSAFWTQILTPNLQMRFGVNPVHSLAEIELLRERFPANIVQYSAYQAGEMVAGTTLFCTPRAIHAQYISSNDAGRDTGAIDLLFHRLITDIYAQYPYFSFGIANEQQGRKLNQGLTEWKEGFGTVVFPHHFYEIPTRNYNFEF